MTCASCAMSIEKTLKVQRGVATVSVNYANASALVEFEPGKITPAELAKAVEGIGYQMITGEDVTTEEIEQQQLKAYRKLYLNTTLAIILSVPLVIIGMAGMHLPYANYIMWALATPVVAWFGKQFFIGAWNQARHRTANMDTLVALSTGIAYLFSVFNTILPHYWMQTGTMAPVYFESAAVIIAFILAGKLLEEKAKSGTSAAIKKLMHLQPDVVTRIKGDDFISMPAADVIVGDELLAKPGEKIAVDGIVVAGTSYIIESMITGEAMPVGKNAGDKVFAGTINQTGSIVYRAEKVGKNTVLAQIIRRVQEAQGSKAPVQKLADRIASVFVPSVIIIAIVTFVVWMAVGGTGAGNHALLAMISVLVVACPCALGLATPTAIIAGIGKGAEQGILVKDAESLEIIKQLNAIVLDKTGTITEGTPSVVDIAWKDTANVPSLSMVLHSMEALSEHPVGAAITSFFRELETPRVDVGSFTAMAGMGVTATYARNIYFAGNRKLLEMMNISIPDNLAQKVKEWSEFPYTIVWLANQFSAQGVVAVSDKVKTTSARAVKELEALGLEVYMLTGDNEQTAYAIAAEAGITRYSSEMSPEGKAAFIKQLQAEGKIVGMAGDGINDSPALASADVSIAMGNGTDIAMDVAKMTLMSSDLRQIPRAINLSARTVRTIRQNLFWAFIYNIIMIPLAAGALYPVNGFLLSPMIAGAAMALSSISVVSNSLRLKWGKD